MYNICLECFFVIVYTLVLLVFVYCMIYCAALVLFIDCSVFYPVFNLVFP